MADLAISLDLIGRDAGLSAAADKAAHSVRGIGDASDHATKASGGLMGALGDVAKIAGGFVVAQGLMKLPELLGAPIAAASNLGEAINKVDVIFADTAGEIKTFAATAAQSLGQSQTQALAATGQFGNLFKAMGLGSKETTALSMDVVSLGSDLASFHNIMPTEALEKLRAGLVGEAEPLRQLGIAMNASTVEAKALEMGLAGSADELTEGMKVQARYAIILEQTKDAQGDFARTSTGMANAQRIISASFDDIVTQIGSAVLPAVAPLVSWFASVLPGAMVAMKGPLDAVGETLTAFGEGAVVVAEALGSSFDLAAATVSAIVAGDLTVAIQTLEDSLDLDLSGLAGAIAIAQEWMQRLQDAFATAVQVINGEWESAPGIDPFVNVLGVGVLLVTGTILPALQAGIQTALDAISAFWTAHGDAIMTTAQTTWTNIQTVVQAVVDVVGPYILDRFTIVQAWVETNWPLIQATIERVMLGVVAVIEVTTALIQTHWSTIETVTQASWTIISTIIDTTMILIGGLIRTMMQLITGDWEGAWTTIQTTADTLFRGVITIVETVGGLIMAAASAVWASLTDAVNTAWEGIKTAIATKFDEARAGIAGAAQAWLDAGTSIATSLMKGVTDFLSGAIPGMVKQMADAAGAALEAVRGLFGAGAAGGGRGSGDDPSSYLASLAGKHGIDAGQLLATMGKEGPGGWNATGNFNTGSSYGPLQLHYAGGSNPQRGMGDDFTRDTGIDLRVDKSVDAMKASLDYAVARLAKTGDYREWYGADNALPQGRFTPVIRSGQRGGQVNQMQMGLDTADAQVACGPAALQWFMNAAGRSPSGAEALQLADAWGWDRSKGMYGPAAFAGAAGTIGSISADFTATRPDLAAALASGQPTAISTRDHYYQAQGGTLGGINVGASGTVVGGSSVMSIDQIEALSGPMNGLIVLLDTARSSVEQVGAVSGAAFGEVGSAIESVNPRVAELAAMQENLNVVIGQGFPQASHAGTMELQAFGAGAQLLVDNLLSGNATLDETQAAMIRMAASTGVAIGPFQQLEAGLITQDQALLTVLATVAEVNPAFMATAGGFIMGATTAEEASLNFLQLAASTGGVTDAVIPADEALRTMAGFMPTVSTLAIEGGLAGDELTKALLGLTEQSGFARHGLDLSTASTEDLNAALVRIVDEMAIVDPRFADLNARIQANGGITDETRGDLVNLIDTLDTVPGVIDPAITAHDNLGAGAKEAASTSADAWKDILGEIRDAVRSIDSTVKTLSDDIVKYLEEISNTKVEVDTKSAVRSLEKVEDAADDAREAISKVNMDGDEGFLKKIGRRAGGGWADTGSIGWVGEEGPELAISRGDYVLSHGEAAGIARNAFASRASSPVVMADGGGRDAAPIQLIVNNYAPIFGTDDVDGFFVDSLKRLSREGRVEGVELG